MEYTIFYLTLSRGEFSNFNKHKFIICSMYTLIQVLWFTLYTSIIK